jgi:hypothetical protein
MLIKWEENQLIVFERKVLRTICGPKLENGVYRRRYNFELQREFDSPCVINIVKTNRFRYVGHMIKRLKYLPQKAIFVTRPRRGTAIVGPLGPQIGRTVLRRAVDRKNFFDRP